MKKTITGSFIEAGVAGFQWREWPAKPKKLGQLDGKPKQISRLRCGLVSVPLPLKRPDMAV